MKSLTAFVVLSVISLVQSVAFASSCTITVPFKLKPSEQQTLTEHGFKVRVKRSEFTHSRFLNVYEYFEVKDSRRNAGDLHLRAVLVPKGPQEATTTAAREFNLQLTTEREVETIAIANTVPANLAHNVQEATEARFSGFPFCGK